MKIEEIEVSKVYMMENIAVLVTRQFNALIAQALNCIFDIGAGAGGLVRITPGIADSLREPTAGDLTAIDQQRAKANRVKDVLENGIRFAQKDKDAYDALRLSTYSMVEHPMYAKPSDKDMEKELRFWKGDSRLKSSAFQDIVNSDVIYKIASYCQEKGITPEDLIICHLQHGHV